MFQNFCLFILSVPLSPITPQPFFFTFENFNILFHPIPTKKNLKFLRIFNFFTPSAPPLAPQPHQ